jgi:hypothetical protein
LKKKSSKKKSSTKSLKHLKRQDFKNNNTNAVPHQALDDTIITPSIISKTSSITYFMTTQSSSPKISQSKQQ